VNNKELEIKVKELENKIKSLQSLQDIEDIKKLQKAYGYYLTNWMHQELIDCFSTSPQTTLEWPHGTYTGPDGPREYYGNINKKENPEFMHQIMQLSGIVDIEPDGNHAKGRWWGFGAMAIPIGSMDTSEGEGVDQSISCGIYEMEYIRENGIWKILKIKWVPVYSGTIEEGWVKPERRAKSRPPRNYSRETSELWHPVQNPLNYNYPSGYILPFHFKHPVTGKKTGEEKRNIKSKLI
jgi:hypothetical protein